MTQNLIDSAIQTHLYHELGEIPGDLRKLLQTFEVSDPLTLFPDRKIPAGLVTIGIGSSEHVAQTISALARGELSGNKLQPHELQLRTECLTADQKPNPSYENWICFAISQSGGGSPDNQKKIRLIEIVDALHKSGATLFAITNNQASKLSRLALHGGGQVFALGVGEEQSIPATKTWAASIICGAKILSAMEMHRGFKVFDESLSRLPTAIETLDRDGLIQDGIGAFDDKPNGIVVVTSPQYLSFAKEVALKLREIAGIQAEAYTAENATHGYHTILQEPGKKLAYLMSDTIAAADKEVLENGLNYKPISFGHLPDFAGAAVDPRVQTLATGLLNVIAADYFALGVGIKFDWNPDVPKNATKVVYDLGFSQDRDLVPK